MIQAIRLGNSHSVNIYTDSQYALAIVHILGVLYQKQGLLTSMGKKIKIKKEVSALVKNYLAVNEACYYPLSRTPERELD